MIAYLRGTILQILPKGAILQAEHVGYFIHLTKTIIAQLQRGEEKEFYIHSHIREDAFDLYGFHTYEELEFFKQLLDVNGIGPKVALDILNTDLDKFKAAIASEDDTFIASTPGIGKKTAQRLILELKGKIDNLTELMSGHEPGTTHHEAMEALLQLGFKRHHITKKLQDLPAKLTDTEAIITYFLKHQ